MPEFLKKQNSDLFLHLGDVAYDNGKTPEEWDNYGKFMEPISSTRPLQHVVGNHDAFCNEKFEQFQDRFSKQPGKISRGGNIFYSFVNLIVLILMQNLGFFFCTFHYFVNRINSKFRDWFYTI